MTEYVVVDCPSSAVCKSCGVPFTDHLGLQGTCAMLQEALAALQKVRSFGNGDDEHGISVSYYVENVLRKAKG
jgi:hypothetical protein